MDQLLDRLEYLKKLLDPDYKEFASRTKIFPQPKEDRPYQNEAAAKLIANGRKFSFIWLATGTGKTLVGAKAWREVRKSGGRLLIVSHKDHINNQIEDTFRSTVDPNILITYNDLNGEVCIWTIQSLLNECRKPDFKERLAGRRFTHIWLDEVHHYPMSQKEDDVWARTIKVVLDSLDLKVWGTTATLFRSDNKPILSQDFVSEEVYKYDINDAVRDEYLVEVYSQAVLTYAVGSIKNEEVKFNRINRQIRNKIIAENAIRVMKADGKEKPFLCFVSRIDYAKELLVELNSQLVANGYKSADIIYGGMPKKNQAEKIGMLRSGGISGLINVDILTEGVDIPSVEMILMARPTFSKCLYMQMLGRGTRLHDRKSDLLIIDFVDNVARLHDLVLSGKWDGQDFNGHLTTGGRVLSSSRRDKDDIINVRYLVDDLESLYKKSTPAYLSFSELKAKVREAKIESCTQYRKRYKEIPRAPSDPQSIYKEFKSYKDLCGKITLSELKLKVNELGIICKAQYRKRYKEIYGAPSNPERAYKDWISWPDLFGTELSFDELKSKVREACIRSSIQYRNEYHRIKGAPSNPDKTYEKEWVSWYDFLGITIIPLLTFSEWKIAIRKACIKSGAQYHKKYKEIPGAPSHPYLTYRAEWVSWYDSLGTTRKQFMSFSEWKIAMMNANIRNSHEYQKQYRNIKGAPSQPWETYKKEWVSWPLSLTKMYA